MSRPHHTVAPSYAPLTVAANVVNPTSYFDTLTPMAQATLQNYMAHMQVRGLHRAGIHIENDNVN